MGELHGVGDHRDGDHEKWGPQGVGTMGSEGPQGVGDHREWGTCGEHGTTGVSLFQELTSRQRTENSFEGHKHPHSLAHTSSWVNPGESVSWLRTRGCCLLGYSSGK